MQLDTWASVEQTPCARRVHITQMCHTTFLKSENKQRISIQWQHCTYGLCICDWERTVITLLPAVRMPWTCKCQVTSGQCHICALQTIMHNTHICCMIHLHRVLTGQREVVLANRISRKPREKWGKHSCCHPREWQHRETKRLVGVGWRLWYHRSEDHYYTF